LRRQPTAAPYESYPPPYPPPYPGPPPGLHEQIDGLPAGAVAQLDQAWQWRTNRQQGAGYSVHAVPFTTGEERLGLAVVISESDASRAVWTLGRDMEVDLAPMAFWPNDGRANEVWVEEADRLWLLVLAWHDDAGVTDAGVTDAGVTDAGVTVTALLPADEVHLALGTKTVRLMVQDWTGDGEGDPILLDTKSNEIELLVRQPDGSSRHLAHLLPESQLVDVDGDGAMEIVKRRNEEWLVAHWTGDDFASMPPINEPVSEPSPVADGALPLLPADLFFLREGSIWRWPSEGGVLEEVVADPRKGRSRGLSRSAPGPGGPPLRSFRVARDAERLVYALSHVERLPSGFDTEITELFVHDLDTGQAVMVADDASSVFSDYGYLSFFGISPDGNWVIYLGSGEQRLASRRPPGVAAPVHGPTEGGGGVEGTFFIVDVAEPEEPRSVADCTGPEEPDGDIEEHYTGGCDGMLLSPDGRRMAYSDGDDLWVLDLPDGEPRKLSEHFAAFPYGTEGWHRPFRWSPDGRYLITEVSYFEGGSAALWDVEAGTVQVVEGTFEYGCCRSDLAWLPDSSGILYASTGYDPPLGIVATDDTSEVTPLIRSLLDETGARPKYRAISPHALPGGEIGFGLRSAEPGHFRGNGVFRIGADGTGWTRIADLPPLVDDKRIEGGWYLGEMLWSARGRAYLFVGRQSESEALIIGLFDGTGLWDASEVLAGASAFRWGVEK